MTQRHQRRWLDIAQRLTKPGLMLSLDQFNKVIRQLHRDDRELVVLLIGAILDERDKQDEQAEHRRALLRLMHAAGIPNDDEAEARLEALGLAKRLDDGTVIYRAPGPRATQTQEE